MARVVPLADKTAGLAAALEQRGPAISRRVIDDMYRGNPFWGERFGERGRGHADGDGDFHVRYLVESIRAGSSAVMIGYARWLRSVLTTRGMCTRHLADNFSRLAAAIAVEPLPDAARAVAVLVAAEGALLYDLPAPRALQERAPSLAATAVTALRRRHPDWFAGGDDGGWSRRLDEAIDLLSYLADAVAANDAGRFVAHARFMDGFLTRRAAPANELRETLRELGAAIAGAGAPLAGSADLAAPILEAALGALPARGEARAS